GRAVRLVSGVAVGMTIPFFGSVMTGSTAGVAVVLATAFWVLVDVGCCDHDSSEHGAVLALSRKARWSRRVRRRPRSQLVGNHENATAESATNCSKLRAGRPSNFCTSSVT